MTTEAQDNGILSLPVVALQEMERIGAISASQLQSIREAAYSTGAEESEQLQISVSSLNSLISSGELSVAQRELFIEKGQPVRPFSILGVPLNVTTVLIIVGIGLIVLSFGGLVKAVFDDGVTRVAHVLLVSSLIAIFIGAGLLVRRKLSPLAGELLVMGGVVLTPWLLGAATTGRGLPLGIVAGSMAALGAIGWYIRRPTAEIFKALSQARPRLNFGLGIVALVLISVVIPFVGVPLLLLLIVSPWVATRGFSPSRIGDTLILISVGITPALLFAAGHAMHVPEGDWNASAVLFPRLAAFVLAYRKSGYFLYGLLICGALSAAPVLTLTSTGYEPSFRLGAGMVAFTGAALVGPALAMDVSEGRKGDSTNLWLWFHIVGLGSLAGGSLAPYTPLKMRRYS